MEENWVKASMCTIKQHFAINYTHGCTLLQRQCSMRIKLWYILTHLLLPPTSSLHCDVERVRHEQPISCKKASTIVRDDEQTTVQSLYV